MKAPIIIPLLFALPPIMKAAQTRKVERAGAIMDGSKPVSFQAQRTPARPAIPAPKARLLLYEKAHHVRDVGLHLRLL